MSFLLEDNFGFSAQRTLVSWLVFAFNLWCLGKVKGNKLSFIVVIIFFVLSTIPALVAFTSGTIYPAKLLIYHQVLFLGVLGLSMLQVDYSAFPTLKKSQSLYLLVIITTVGIIPYLLVYGPHINWKNLFLLDVYKTRAATQGLSNIYFGYTYSLFTKIIIPLIIIFALELKNRLLAVLGVFYLVLFYLFGAHKTVYIGIIIVVAFYRFNYLKSASWIVFLSILLLVVSIFLAIFGFDLPWIITFRRVHFLPTLLDIAYLDYFRDNFMYWSESIFSGFFDYPYDQRHEYIIGELYFNRPDMAANNGLISDGYMNMGSVGVLVNTFLIGSYFMLLNSLNISSKYFGLYFLVVFSFISSSIFTVFLTHGAIALLLISIFLLRERNEQDLPPDHSPSPL